MKAPLSGVESQLEIAYSIRSGWLAVGFNEEWVRMTLESPAAGARLADGADYARVRSQLDEEPELIAYANLPKLLTRVQNSNMIKMMLGADAEVQRMFDLFANEQTLNVGWGHTSSEVDGAARTTTFGPSALSGGAMYAGIVAAIAIPNFLNAVDRGKQKRTLADVQSIGTAIESYRIDAGLYPTTEGWQTVDAIAGLLEPVYIRTLPRVDGWGHPIRIFADGESYTLASPGKDGQPDREWVGEVETGPTTSWDDDVVDQRGQVSHFNISPETRQGLPRTWFSNVEM